MKFILALASVAFPTAQAAKEVFAHMIVGNLPQFTLSDWEADIALAQESSIDAFVLNIGAQDQSNDNSLTLAFQAANSAGFKLFFSFDYAPQGAWPKDQVIALLEKFGNDPAYFKTEGDKPFVSTFEGPGSAEDWTEIKQATNAVFVPDWSSVAPQDAIGLGGGVADGLFSFDSWPTGDTNATVAALDKPFLDALGDNKLFMMPVSPWFYTNLPKLDKNWLWRGDELWETRWENVMEAQPDFVQILTWNDYGESHYIGPVHENQLELFNTFEAPINYARGLTHDGWRKFLPFYIAQYKTGQAPIEFTEQAVAYYRTAPALACPSGGTTGNNADFGETEVPPETLMEDAVFFSALLTSDEGVTVSVSIGGQAQEARFTTFPKAGAGTPGVYRGSVPFGSNTGDVVVTVSRGDQVVATAEGGKPISTECENNIQNWNAVAV